MTFFFRRNAISERRCVTKLISNILFMIPASDDSECFFDHLGVGYLSASLQELYFESVIVNMPIHDMKNFQAAKLICRMNPDAVGMTLLDESTPSALELTAMIRNKGYSGLVILGGYGATGQMKLILSQNPGVDVIVYGEGEKTFQELIKKMKTGSDWRGTHGIAFKVDSGIQVNPPRPLIANLDEIPFPVRPNAERTILERLQATILGTRGCFADCSFCAIRNFYGLSPGRKRRSRSIENIAEEIDWLAGRYPDIAEISFVDDSFLPPGSQGLERAYEFARILSRLRNNISLTISIRASQVDRRIIRMLKRVGLKSVFLGVESINERALKLLNKNQSPDDAYKALAVLDEEQIVSGIGYIGFDPFTTPDELKRSAEFYLQRLSKGSKVVTISNYLRLFSNIPLLEEFKQKGVLIREDYSFGFRFIDHKTDFIFKCLQTLAKNYTDNISIRTKQGALNMQVMRTQIGKRRYSIIIGQINQSFLRIIEAEVRLLLGLIELIKRDDINRKKLTELVIQFEKQVQVSDNFLKMLEQELIGKKGKKRIKTFCGKWNGSCFIYDMLNDEFHETDELTRRIVDKMNYRSWEEIESGLSSSAEANKARLIRKQVMKKFAKDLPEPPSSPLYPGSAEKTVEAMFGFAETAMDGYSD